MVPRTLRVEVVRLLGEDARVGFIRRSRDATDWVRDESWKSVETVEELHLELRRRFGYGGRRDSDFITALTHLWFERSASSDALDWKRQQLEEEMEAQRRATAAEQYRLDRARDREVRERSRVLEAEYAHRVAEEEAAAQTLEAAAQTFAVRQRREQAVREAREVRARAARDEWERGWSERESLSAGEFDVSLIGGDRTDELLRFLALLPALRNQQVHHLEEMVERAIHIAPEVIAGQVGQQDAVAVKTAIEERGGRARISHCALPAAGASRRRAIPERVRSEVWRRDGGACVECGSRERLEFHHIIPHSRGGADTARNLELLCERCHRPKGNVI